MKDDNDYLEARAEKELGMAQQAEQPAAVRAHYKLAELYLERVHGTAGQEGNSDENP